MVKWPVAVAPSSLSQLIFRSRSADSTQGKLEQLHRSTSSALLVSKETCSLGTLVPPAPCVLHSKTNICNPVADARHHCRRPTQWVVSMQTQSQMDSLKQLVHVGSPWTLLCTRTVMLWRSLHATPVFYMKNDPRFGGRQS